MTQGNRWVLVTGASGGIGLELSYLFAANGYSLVLVARSGDKLERLAGELRTAHPIDCLVVPADLSDPGTPEMIDERVRMAGIAPEVLVNNAGFGDFGEFSGTDWEKTRNMLEVNIAALTHLIRLLLPGMLRRARGRILNVASIASFQPGPLMAVYYATKAYVLSFSEAIAREVRGSGVTVTALCPGPTATNFSPAANLEKSRLFVSLKPASAAKVAAFGYRAMMRGKAVAVYGGRNRLMIFAQRFAPRRLVRSIVYNIQRRIRD